MIKYQGKTIEKVQANYVVISSVSVNTTPSRALDILIASNQFKRIGFVDSKLIEPAVGSLNKKIEDGRLGLPAEVYHKDDVAIIQLRSNIRMGRKKEFVEELSQLISKTFGQCTVLVVGSLPFSLRPDLQIQSVGKNTYYYSKDGSEELKKAETNGIIKSIKLLIDHDEEVTEIIGEAGFIKNLIKSEKFPKFSYLCVFSEILIDHEAAVRLAKAVSIVSGKKELGTVEQNILNQ